MLGNLPIIEILLFILGGVASILGFLYKAIEERVKTLEIGLQDHRVDDAKEFITRQEIKELKDDLRGMISPLNTKMSDIENFLRDAFKINS